MHRDWSARGEISSHFRCCMRGVLRRFLMTSLCLVYAFMWTAGDVLHRAYCPHHQAANTSDLEGKTPKHQCSHCCQHEGSYKSSATAHGHGGPSSDEHSDSNSAHDEEHHSEPCGICQLFAQAIAPVEFTQFQTASASWEPLVSDKATFQGRCVLIRLVTRGPPA